MDNEINPQEIVGRTVTNVFETEPYEEQDGIPGLALYFYIVIELDGTERYDLGAHKISKWTKADKLIAIKNDPDIIGKRIVRVIEKDPEKYYEGSLILLLENNIVIEHVMSNGDQLQCADFDDDA